ncbi:zinc ABC transporter substrate-binding protein [Oleispirillum naphthae]|uniref:zinc ABC transporter substrate-binding protein n=1 Tax=Oleispirillum naphthae TaxID=2838853 RepID=UPI00308248C2
MQRWDVKILAMAMAGLGFSAGAAAAAPTVAVSIAPLAGIAAAVMADAGKPTLLLPPGQSPHHAALKPSQARALTRTDVVLWIGPDMEMGLDKALDARPEDWVKAHVMTAMSLPGVTLRQFRHLEEIGPDEREPAHEDAHEKPHAGETHAAEEHHHHHGSANPHLWLDPANGAAIAQALAERLAALDAAHAALYRANAARFAASLETLKGDLAARLSGLGGKGFVVFHDAYAYFEEPFGLTAVAALTLDPGQPIGGKHLSEVRDKVRATGAVCVFADEQASKQAVAGMARDLGLRVGTLDPIGAHVAPGPDAYPALLRNLAEAYRACLGK